MPLGGENLPQLRPFEVLRDLRGVALPRRIPSWLAAWAGAAEDARARVTGRPPRLTRGAVEIFCHDWPLDSGAAARDLDYEITPFLRAFPTILEVNRST